ncbi:ClpS [Desulforapulum autotrophicum HRM2]|uniref:ATP-dependent Clp protease adapter protein ClpS n=1 Tax=Desulforapulum autotrophicum (strain ATCC 43914 / DSM 3382 / VKM B-1955 / HRM2) TaxID=177437 RepID=CLPS_DESAH|nr:ATP-dependent Clp protease adapter ClpS [Desulforapulum autotrophicum]C0QI24.1 RecName: Full=ATP-dependent Clp protease adapter protein ClpS [Desulforapulum autotrophicum HRM2]ACN15760.1 ClpS [Desulforapulum autotrophicum HRM2]
MSLNEPSIKQRTSSKVEKKEGYPPMYRVVLHNDDYTTMEFVVQILITVFGKSLEKASIIMLNIHKQGKGICGSYTREVAETKVNTVHHLAREQGFPLKSTMEKE